MSCLQIIDEGGGRFAVNGDLTFITIAKDTVKSLTFLASAKNITIDLSRVTNTDSAGLALMIECIKQARSNKTALKFCNIPKQLLNLAKISGLDEPPYFTSQLEN
ncbi:MAG: STAS domain-containing protein [Methylovulum sp.]|uniref:STAS domain-containing protein n=1 Tax=Methylovulum sp. TaxID=1916980 RepID=UPI00260E702E|nr:STAS domain-containing protein [Methylovulum sp.]MDD2725109.1 STAS domain-containing protein [Methylovulum sp.]MDD5125853.1 STAS domain-containing protein [Methylovulum sp.]